MLMRGHSNSCGGWQGLLCTGALWKCHKGQGGRGMNRICLIGRLVADPQLRYSQSGTAVTNFRIAVDRPFTAKETDFIDCIAFRKLAEVVANNLTKGRLVGVDGRLQIREYDAQGQKRRVAEVVADTVQF